MNVRCLPCGHLKVESLSSLWFSWLQINRYHWNQCKLFCCRLCWLHIEMDFITLQFCFVLFFGGRNYHLHHNPSCNSLSIELYWKQTLKVKLVSLKKPIGKIVSCCAMVGFCFVFCFFAIENWKFIIPPHCRRTGIECPIKQTLQVLVFEDLVHQKCHFQRLGDGLLANMIFWSN